MGQALREKGPAYLIIGPFAIVLAFPFYVMVITAFKDQSELYDPSVTPYWFGKDSPTLANASFLFHHTQYPTWLVNTAIVGVCRRRDHTRARGARRLCARAAGRPRWPEPRRRDLPHLSDSPDAPLHSVLRRDQAGAPDRLPSGRSCSFIRRSPFRSRRGC